MKRKNWKSDIYLYPVKKAMVFPSKEERQKALELFWKERSSLCGCPRDYINALTLVVPEQAIAHFEKKGIKFTLKDVNGASI